MNRHVCNSDCEQYDGGGFIVCKHTGAVLHQIIVNGFEKTSDAVFSRANNTGASTSGRVQSEHLNGWDKKSGKYWQNYSLVLDTARLVLKVNEHAKKEEWEYDGNASLVRAYTEYCQVNERNQNKNGKKELMFTEKLAKRILLYYSWCIKQTNEDRIPKLRMFTIAMLCIMREGLESNDVYLIPRCSFCFARITEMKSFTSDILDGCKPRSLTTAIRFIKSIIYDAMQKEGGVFRVLEVLTNLENNI